MRSAMFLDFATSAFPAELLVMRNAIKVGIEWINMRFGYEKLDFKELNFKKSESRNPKQIQIPQMLQFQNPTIQT